MASDGSPTAGGDPEQEGGDYEKKLANLQKYLPFLNTTIERLESSKDKVRASQLSKMKNLQQILTSNKQRMRPETLDRCEDVLKKLQDRLKVQIPSDDPEPRKNIKTEPEEVVESPASPPQPDLHPPKSTPKIIPVERCAAVERDFSKTEEETTLEASRCRLKGLMLKTELKQTPSVTSTSSPHIPGLDLIYANKEPETSRGLSVESTFKTPCDKETRFPIQNASRPPQQEEWRRLESTSQSTRERSGDWLTSRTDVDERRLTRDLDYRPLRRGDIDERNLLECDPRGLSAQPEVNRIPSFTPASSHVASINQSLLPRHMPSHNMGYPPSSCSSSQDFPRPKDNVRLETSTPLQSISKPSASSSTPLSPTEWMERSKNTSRLSVPQREVYDLPSSSSLLPASKSYLSPSIPQRDGFESRASPLLPTPKSFTSSGPHGEFDRRNVPNLSHLSSKLHGPTPEANKTSAREKILQGMDVVEKLGVPRGGALRALKSNLMDKTKRRPVETDMISSEEIPQRKTDVVSRDPRLEREQRRGSAEEEAQKSRAGPRIPPLITSDSQSGYSPSIVPPNMPSYGGPGVAFANTLSGSTQWNQSHSSAVNRTIFQGQSVINTYQWQTTCTVKQTTAHDLGLRYQPRSRQGKLSHSQHLDRSLPSTSSKPIEDKHPSFRESESQRKDNEPSHVLGRRQSDPRLPPFKSQDEGKRDGRPVDPRRKDKAPEKDGKDFASPLDSLYSIDKRSKTGQGYGLQKYKIPKRPQEPSPPEDLNQTSKQNSSDLRAVMNRDPRLSKGFPLPTSPERFPDTVAPLECPDITSELAVESSSAGNAEDADDCLDGNKTELPEKSSSQVSSICGSPKVQDLDCSDQISSSTQSNQNEEGPNATEKFDRSPPRRAHSRLRSKSRSSSPHRRRKSRGRSRSKSRGRSSYQSRNSSATRDKPSRSGRRSRSHSRDQSRSNSRGKSRERSKSRLRDRSRSNSSGESRRGRSRSGSRTKVEDRGRSRSRGKSIRRSTSRARDKMRDSSRSRSRARSKQRSPHRRRDVSRGRSSSRSRCKSRGRSTSRSRDRSRPRSLSRRRGKSRERSLSRSRAKSRGRNRSVSRGRSRTRDSDTERSSTRAGEKSKYAERSESRSKDRYSGRSKSKVDLRGSSRSRHRSRDASSKVKGRHSSSRSLSRDKKSPSSSRERPRRKYRSGAKSPDRARARSPSSDSDKSSEFWRKKQSPSPERGHAYRKRGTHRSRKRYISSSSDESRGVSPRSFSSSQDRSRNPSKSREKSRKQITSKKRSLSRESLKSLKKNSRSSSCSDRSSPLFPRQKSKSRSPCHEKDFDSLLKRDSKVGVETLSVSLDPKDVANKTALDVVCQKEVVSSSLCVASTGIKIDADSDVAVDVPTSTSENIPETASKSDVGSSSEVNATSVPKLSVESKQESSSVEPENILVGLLKTLKSPDILLELAQLAASQLPEDKRAKVLELFKAESEGTKNDQTEAKSSLPACASSSSTANTVPNAEDICTNEPSETPVAPGNSKAATRCRTVKRRKKKMQQRPKAKTPQVSVGPQKSEVSHEGTEKQKKKRGKNELEKLHEDIREMFICNEVVTATGQRSCRQRKENKETISPLPPKRQSGFIDEKSKPSHNDEVNLSDASPNKSHVMDSTGSSSDFQPTDSMASKLKYSSESDEDVPISKCRKTIESSDLKAGKLNKTSFLDSESESDFLMHDEDESRSPKVPLVVLKNVQTARRNVARRGRKTGSISRSESKHEERAYTPSCDGDYEEDNDAEGEESKVEDKDMSQIDTSNIIHVEGIGSKLTRNQLKRFKEPVPKSGVRPASKRASAAAKEMLDYESDVSKASEILLDDLSESSLSPVKKKRKVKRGKVKEILEIEPLGGEINPSQGCRSSSHVPDEMGYALDHPITRDSNLQELPLMSRILSESSMKDTSGSSDGRKKTGLHHHEDLDYTCVAPEEKAMCKICNFSGKTIVSHYVLRHPSEEVFISRLPRNLADQVKAESSKFEGDLKTLISKYSARKRLSVPLRCLLCPFAGNTSLRLYEHVSTHTGEYRFSCSECSFKAARRMTMKSHRKTHHSDVSLRTLCKVLSPEINVSMKVLFAHLCSECNFFQLREGNIRKHLQTYHAENPSARALRINISKEVPLTSETYHAENPSAEANQSHVSKEIPLTSEDSDSRRQNLMDIINQVAENTPDERNPDESLMASVPEAHCESTPEEDPLSCEKSGLSSEATCVTEVLNSLNQPSTSVDMSIFIGSDEPSDDDSQLQEKRKKLLEDAEVKIRDRPKIRSSISEKLAQRLESEPKQSTDGLDKQTDPPSVCDDITISQLVSESSSSFERQTSKFTLKTTPGRSTPKSSDLSEKRFTRSISRSSLTASDSETVTISNEVPDEVKAPLTASILHNTLQRMQETIQCPSSTSSSQPSSSDLLSGDLSPHRTLILKKGSVKVGLVEARALNESQRALFVCLFSGCGFKSELSSEFQDHIDKHSPKPVSAPCSVCVEGGNILRDLSSSLNHLLKYHLHEVDFIEEVVQPSKPLPIPSDSSDTSRKFSLIRPRKLPGDVLSQLENSSTDTCKVITSSELPSLVISSVVSLSKDHSPDGTPLVVTDSTSHERDHQEEGALKTSIGNFSLSSSKKVMQFKKDQRSMKEMMKFEKVCNFFKCMGQHCYFSTNRKDIFAEHYEKHVGKEQQRSVTILPNSFEWQKCVYCGVYKDSGEDLVSHVTTEHNALQFQCSGCFYRAASVSGVIFHQEKCHTSKVTVFQCKNQAMVLYTQFPQQQINKVQLYKCCQACVRGPCGLLFVSSEDFLTHLKALHPSDMIFYCCECSVSLDCPSKLICHYSTSHCYRMYHCLHCPKASETKDEIGFHMCIDHPDKQMLVAARIRLADIAHAETAQLPNGLVIGIANVGEKFCMQPTSPAPDVSDTDSNDVLFFDKEPSLPCLNFDIGANYGAAKSKSLVNLTSSSKSTVKIGSDLGPSEITLDCPPQDIQISGNSFVSPDEGLSLPHIKDDGVVGLSGSSLYKCGYLGCSFQADMLAVFKEHVLGCGLGRDSGALKCPHCQKVCRHPLSLLEHLPRHGIPRYVCGICEDFRTTHPNSALRHVKNRHKIHAVDLVQSEYSVSDPDKSLIIVRPKETALKRGRAKTQTSVPNKTIFGPEDRNSLPLSAVFTCNVTCSVCQYATKVRSNMLRHLEQHALGCDPSPVPVLNPVPYLERNEKMFDTMTNHAISSTIPVRRDSNAFKVTDEPRFIPENQRYVCCAPACHQISSDDAMLRHHIRVLHPEILVYKCPHCPDSDVDGKQPIMLEKLGSHLKMHDSRLYSCLSCTYYHYHRHIVERHTGEKHPDQKLIRIVREPKADGPCDTENIIDIESEISGAEGSYECTLCSLKGNKADVIAHVASVHRIHALFKCTLCNWRTNTRTRFSNHFSKHHPNVPEDFIEVVQKSKSEKTSDDSFQPPPEPPAVPTEPNTFDSTPLWRRNAPRVRHLRGILFEENGLKPKELEHSDTRNTEAGSSSRIKRPLLSTNNSDDGPTPKKEKIDPLICFVCDMKFSFQQEKEFNQHMGTHFRCHVSGLKCLKCYKSYQKADDLVAHIKAVHPETMTVKDIGVLASDAQNNLDVTSQNQDADGLKGKVTDSLPGEQHLSPSSDLDLSLSPRCSRSPVAMNTKKAALSAKNKSPLSSGASTPKKSIPSTGKSKSPVKGIRPLSERSVLKPTFPLALETSQPNTVSSTPSLSLDTQTEENPAEIPTRDSEVLNDPVVDVDIEVDESALELDIEEVEEDEEIPISSEHVSCAIEPSSNVQDVPITPAPSKGTSCGFECKYKDSHGCNFISKSKLEASYHEKRHWEVQPLKCGYCDYQAVREGYIRIHNAKRHPGVDVKIITNELPDVPTIVPLLRQSSKPKSSVGSSPVSQKNLSSDERAKDDVIIAELANDEDIFKSVNVLRCGFCRLRETSLRRLLAHWQCSHSNNKTLLENAPDGRRVVPFKFREVKLGDHEKETMAFRCGLCSRSGTVKLLAEHYPSRHPGAKLKISELIHDRVQCLLCPRQFSGKTSLTSHFSSCHPGEQVGSCKVKAQDNSDDLDARLGCLYCMEQVKTASELKDHHLNFHSHLNPKYIVLDTTETASKEMSSKRSDAECSENDADKIGHSDVCPTNPSRPSVIFSVRRMSQEESSSASEIVSIEPAIAPAAPSGVKRAVARKSTSKVRVRAVARKSTGGKVSPRSTQPVVHDLVSSSESDDEDEREIIVDDEDEVDESKISCPMMIEGTTMRVSLATLSKYSNIYPSIALQRPLSAPDQDS